MNARKALLAVWPDIEAFYISEPGSGGPRKFRSMVGRGIVTHDDFMRELRSRHPGLAAHTLISLRTALNGILRDRGDRRRNHLQANGVSHAGQQQEIPAPVPPASTDETYRFRVPPAAVSVRFTVRPGRAPECVFFTETTIPAEEWT